MKPRSHTRHVALALRALRAALTHLRGAVEAPAAEGSYTTRLARLEARRCLLAAIVEHQRTLAAERAGRPSRRAA